MCLCGVSFTWFPLRSGRAAPSTNSCAPSQSVEKLMLETFATSARHCTLLGSTCSIYRWLWRHLQKNRNLCGGRFPPPEKRGYSAWEICRRAGKVMEKYRNLCGGWSIPAEKRHFPQIAPAPRVDICAGGSTYPAYRWPRPVYRNRSSATGRYLCRRVHLPRVPVATAGLQKSLQRDG